VGAGWGERARAGRGSPRRGRALGAGPIAGELEAGEAGRGWDTGRAPAGRGRRREGREKRRGGGRGSPRARIGGGGGFGQAGDRGGLGRGEREIWGEGRGMTGGARRGGEGAVGPLMDPKREGRGEAS
jgi:ribonuclease R